MALQSLSRHFTSTKGLLWPRLSRTAFTRAVVLEKAGEIRIRDIDINEPFGPHDVRINIKSVGICGSDVHYYEVCSSSQLS